MLSAPNELMDAARIDGCTEFGIYWRIVMPIQKPAFGILAILAFNGAWNDFPADRALGQVALHH
jgi:ABC-type glycerol-3-phosphate transport system permease component